MKKVLAILLAMLLLLGLMVGCSSSGNDKDNSNDNSNKQSDNTDDTDNKDSSGDKTFKVGIITYYVSSSFESSFNTAAQKRCEELGLEYASYDADKDMAAYQTCFENAAVDGCDAIVCVPSDPTAMGPQCDVCEENDIYLVVMAVAPDGYYSTAIVVDDAVKGEMKAQLIVDNIGKGGKVLMLLGNQEQTGWVTNNDAAKKVFADNNIEIVAEEDPKAALDQAMIYMENWLSQGLEFDAIWCATDTVAAGACAALEQAGYDFDSVYIVGEDGDETGLRLIEAGQLDATLSLNGIMYGTSTVNAAYDWLMGNNPDAITNATINVATKDNVEEFLAELPEASH